MGDFKPLMKLGAQTVLEREIQTLRACGVHEITIITGRRAEDIRAAAAGPGIHFIHNPADLAVHAAFLQMFAALQRQNPVKKYSFSVFG